MSGPIIASTIVEVFVFRCPGPEVDSAAGGDQAGGGGAHPLLKTRRAVEFLQMRRVRGPISGSWQPVMGHIEEGETAVAGALREVQEEAGFKGASTNNQDPRAIHGFWQLETPDCYFLASADRIMISPCFAVKVAGIADPVLDDAHDAFRWVARDQVERQFLWPGQRHAVEQIMRDILAPDSPVEPYLRLARK